MFTRLKEKLQLLANDKLAEEIVDLVKMIDSYSDKFSDENKWGETKYQDRADFIRDARLVMIKMDKL